MRYFFHFFLLLLASCNNNTSYGDQGSLVFNIDEESFREEVPASSFLKGISYLRLEENNDCYIGEITKLYIANEIFVFDRQNKCVFKFSKEGEFLAKLSNEGRGPGQYTAPVDLAIVEDEIYVLDVAVGKVLVYDNSSLSFKREFDSPFNARNIHGHKDHLWFYISPDRPNPPFVVTDLTGNELGAFLNPREYKTYIGGSNTFSTGGLVSEPFTNSFFEIKNDSLSKYLELDFGEYNINHPKDVQDMNTFFDSKFLFRREFFELKDYFMFSFIKENKRQYGIFRLSGKEKFWGNVDNDIANVPFFPRFNTQNMLVGIFQEEDLVSSGQDLENCKLLNQSIRANNNPILVFYEVK